MRYQVGPYDVKAKLHYLGPVVWTGAYTDQEETRRTDFTDTKAAPLPPQLSPEQQSLLAVGLLAGLLHDFVLPELTKRYQRSVSEQEFLSSPMWQSQVRQVLIIFPVDGPPIVSLNEEVAEKKIPAGCSHRLLLREGYMWQIKGDWLPQFPAAVQEQVQTSITQLAEAILRGDEKSAGEMARLWFPGLWEDSPRSIRHQLHREIYVLLFRLAALPGRKVLPLILLPSMQSKNRSQGR
jgi:hypothetical protein